MKRPKRNDRNLRPKRNDRNETTKTKRPKRNDRKFDYPIKILYNLQQTDVDLKIQSSEAIRPIAELAINVELVNVLLDA